MLPQPLTTNIAQEVEPITFSVRNQKKTKTTSCPKNLQNPGRLVNIINNVSIL